MDERTRCVSSRLCRLLTHGPVCAAKHYRTPLKLPLDPPVPQDLNRLGLVDYSQ